MQVQLVTQFDVFQDIVFMVEAGNALEQYLASLSWVLLAPISPAELLVVYMLS